MPNSYDVLVIGAGIAGLGAAAELAKRGKKVVVLEARNRIGGRILSLNPAPAAGPVELGAEFVHGGNPALRAAARVAGIRLKDIGRSFWICRDGEFQPFPEYWSRLGNVIAGIPAGTKLSFDAFLRTRPDINSFDRARTREFVESFNAAPAGKISANALRADRGGTDAAQFRPSHGYQPLLDSLEKRLRRDGAVIRLRTTALSVHWKPGEVVVRSNRGSLRARAAIVTLPIGLLRADLIRFAPPLPKIRLLARQIGWGDVARITIAFRRDLWRSSLVPPELRRGGRPRFAFLSAPGVALPVWWVPDPKRPVLVGWNGGPADRKLLELSPARLRDSAVKALASLWRQPASAIAAAVTGYWTHNWKNDPWSRGAYSYPAVGGETAPGQIAEPIQDTLFFAGEAMADEPGTVHGALETGIEAARKVLV